MCHTIQLVVVTWVTSLGFDLCFGLSIYYGAKIKKTAQDTKGGLKTKNKKKAWLPPDSASSENGFITDDDPDPTLRDIMNAIGKLSTCVAANEEKLAATSTFMAKMQLPSASSIRVSIPTTFTATQGTGSAPGGAPPPPEKDWLPEVAETVWARMANWL